MWAAAAPLPYYSAYKPQRRRATLGSSGKDKDGPLSTAASSPHSSSSSNIAELLEPAVDGPPSPERIRALNKQMRRASILDKQQQQSHQGQQHQHHHAAASSASGSLLSLGSDRPSWEQTLENLTLSRRSSGRSTASSMPSRERPESVQLFGKSIFNRRGRLKRESSTHSSSGSSLYSTDNMSAEPMPSSTTSAPKEQPHFIPSLFGRRKSTKGGNIHQNGTISEERRQPPPPVSLSRTKLHISGPYNFQHVTHTRRDHLPNIQRSSRMELASEFSALRAAQPPTTGTLRGIQADDLHFSNFSSEALHLSDEPGELLPPQPHTHIVLDRPMPQQLRQANPFGNPGPRRLVKHTRSQEQLRISPPRPPRPPIEPAFIPPVPPPRISSRISIRYDGFDPLGTTTLDRPQTSGGFRHPRPFSPTRDSGVDTLSALDRPSATSHGFPPRSASTTDFERLAAAAAAAVAANAETEEEARCFAHALTTPDDAAWPLTSPGHFAAAYESPLPDVPEEEEHYVLSRRSRASLISSNSSLRGSQSVPLLRQLAQSQSQLQLQPQSSSAGSTPAIPQRPASSESVTLGRFDAFAAQRELNARMMMLDENGLPLPESLPRESWEDAIDYCYEHEADADFDYAWDRPSLDQSRDDGTYTPDVSPDHHRYHHHHHASRGLAAVQAADHHRHPRSSPNLLLSTPGRFDIPALSPASQASTAPSHEALTPTAPTMVMTTPVTSNFSLPRQYPQQQQQHQHQYQQQYQQDGGQWPRGGSQYPRHLHLRTASHASSFKESHGFHLSPSLLIPRDFQHQMTLEEADVEVPDFHHGHELDDDYGHEHLRHLHQGHDGLMIRGAGGHDEDSTLTVNTTMAVGGGGGNVRTSAASSAGSGSSVEDDDDDRNGSGDERHASSASTWTTLTRLTESTTSLAHSDGWNSKGSMVLPPLQSPPGAVLLLDDGDEDDAVLSAGADSATPVPPSPRSARSTSPSAAEVRKTRQQQAKSMPEPTLGNPGKLTRAVSRDALVQMQQQGHQGQPPQSPMLSKQKRPRARTTSLSTPPPPGQYALFPPKYGNNRF